MPIKTALITNLKAGLVIVLPISIAVFVFFWLVSLLSEPFFSLSLSILEHLDADLEKHALILSWLSKLLACILLIFLPFIIGLFAKSNPFLFFSINRFFLRIPVLGKIYRFILEITQATLGCQTNPFQESALFSFPQSNSFVLGFKTGKVPHQIQKETSVDVAFFIPTAPYPLSNFLLLTDYSNLHCIPANTQDVLQFVISCGTINLSIRS